MRGLQVESLAAVLLVSAGAFAGACGGENQRTARLSHPAHPLRRRPRPPRRRARLHLPRAHPRPQRARLRPRRLLLPKTKKSRRT